MPEFTITTNQDDLDMALVHRFLSEQTYWAKGIPRATLERAIEHSLCFAGYLDTSQIAFARVISDYATFAYLCDVFVLPGHRGNGYSKRLMAAIDAHPQLQGLRRFMLVTSDAHGLYEQFGFAPPQSPQTIMARHSPNIYLTTR